MIDYDKYDAAADNYERRHATHPKCVECGACGCVEGLCDGFCESCWQEMGVADDKATAEAIERRGFCR
jgi:hypothetical protein